MADGEDGGGGEPAAGGSGGGNGNALPPAQANKPFSLSFAKVARPAISVGGQPKEEGVVKELIKGVEGAEGWPASLIFSFASMPLRVSLSTRSLPPS